MNKSSDEYKLVSSEIRQIVSMVIELTKWSKEEAITWMKLPNLKFKGENPTKLIMDGKSSIIWDYLVECKNEGKGV
jgi:hypothetical protein